MDNNNNNLEYNFSEHEFPDIRPGKCSVISYAPSHSEKLTGTNKYTFYIVSSGKGILTYADHVRALIPGMGFFVPDGVTLHIKADNTDPFKIIAITALGNAVNPIIQMIQARENDVVMNFESNMLILDYARDLLSECAKSYSTDYSILALFLEFINSIAEYYSEKKIPSKNIYMTRAVEYIKQNYNKSISVEEIANTLGIERSYLSRLFKTHKNKSTQNYIIDYRINKAKRLFEEEDMNVSQVCAAVGYTNIYCFSRIFKSRVGISPKQYMEKCRNKNV